MGVINIGFLPVSGFKDALQDIRQSPPLNKRPIAQFFPRAIAIPYFVAGRVWPCVERFAMADMAAVATVVSCSGFLCGLMTTWLGLVGRLRVGCAWLLPDDRARMAGGVWLV